MAHEIIFDDARGINPIAFVGEVPWHGLGQQLTPGQPLEVWAQQAGMDFEIENSNVSFVAPGLSGRTRFNYPGKKVLYRNDTQAPLGIVGKGYKVVQPIEVLEFFRDLIDTAGFKMNTAGVLFGGSKYWALAETGESFRLMGQDKVDAYVLLATACDGSLATTAMGTQVRVVCNNTLGFAVGFGENGSAKNYLKVPHSRKFNPDEVKAELGLVNAGFGAHAEQAQALAGRKVKDKEALEWLVRVFSNLKDDEDINPEDLDSPQSKNVKTCLHLYKGGGIGSDLKSADGTAWGLVNSVTEWADHRRNTRTVDNKLESSWFGDVARLKQKAWDLAVKLAA